MMCQMRLSPSQIPGLSPANPISKRECRMPRVWRAACVMEVVCESGRSSPSVVTTVESGGWWR
eukprot:3196442-Rhodomonas_salina.1